MGELVVKRREAGHYAVYLDGVYVGEIYDQYPFTGQREWKFDAHHDLGGGWEYAPTKRELMDVLREPAIMQSMYDAHEEALADTSGYLYAEPEYLQGE